MKIVRTFAIGILIIFAALLTYLFLQTDLKDFIASLNPSEPAFLDHTPEIPDSIVIRRLKIDNVFWANRLKLARDESIDLLVDLIDNQISLEIRGVLVYKASIRNYVMSESLRNLIISDNYLDWLQEPGLLNKEWATIAKEPIQIREIKTDGAVDSSLSRIRDPEADVESIVLLNFSNQLALKLRQIESVQDVLVLPDSTHSANPYLLEIFTSKNSVNTVFRALNCNSSQLAIRTN
jgi:hypothetical protein